MATSSNKIFNPAFLIGLVVFMFTRSISFGQSPAALKVYVSTWDKNRAVGRLESITDTSISVKTKKGQVHTFSASNTKSLRIWKPGFEIPSAIAGAVVGGLVISQIGEQRMLEKYIVGVPVGLIGGLLIGNLVASKVNARSIHIQDFKNVRAKLKM